jgi:dephospho-CoA kinase
MIWIGLTGPMACGKTTVSNIFKDIFSVPVIDADRIAKQALEPGSPIFHAVLDHFGSGIEDEKGAIDRKKLGKVVFENSEERQWLESQVHPYVQNNVLELKTQYQLKGFQMAIYDVPLLFEKSLMFQFDTILLVACTKETQIHRAKQRDQLAESEILTRINNQLPLSAKIEKSHYIIWNDRTTDLNKLQSEVKKYRNWVLNKYKRNDQT